MNLPAGRYKALRYSGSGVASAFLDCCDLSQLSFAAKLLFFWKAGKTRKVALPQNGKFFFKYRLPISEAPKLFAMLQACGYDAGRHFPGYGDAAMAVINDSRIANIE
ncbi:MAG TPA: hypothetical protein VMM76_27315 [Pirellulaceae bacterium]|nr:hypothetical protein [Pirellulaceae bacterium]